MGLLFLQEERAMKAAICYEYGQPLSVEDVSLDPPQRGEVQVRIEAVAVCHSDVHRIRGDWKGRLPIVMGHEAAGVVEITGEGVEAVRPGDRVAVSLLRSCGRCAQCLSGTPYLCEGSFAIGPESRLHNRDGVPLLHGLNTAAFAEATIVDQSQVVRIPDALPMDRAALLACGVITGVGAAIHTAQVRPGASVVVIGTGGVGLNAIQGAALAGAMQIVALDILDRKLESAIAFGATATVNPAKGDARKAVYDLTGGRGADEVLVTVGSAEAIAQGLTLLRPGGTLVIVGLPRRDALAQVPAFDLVAKGQRVLGSYMGSSRLTIDVPWLASLYLLGRLKLDELITAHYPLDRINEAIEAMERGEAIRNIIVPHEEVASP
jgi:S-(hydroxymethyl)glutathione dehydrogenase/alcohol dehydrogenase